MEYEEFVKQCDKILQEIYGIYQIDKTWDMFAHNYPNESKKTCTHNWKNYQGLSESYEYCTVCDEKRK